MNRTKLQSRLAHAAGALSAEASCWRLGSPPRLALARAAQQAMAASAAVHHSTERQRRAAEALLDAAHEQVVRYAVARLEQELERTP